ncbi:MAG TPA: hypothetical protein VGL55_14600 [Steroidobacteraceae bacterium]|jgi:hypothetical protein
MIFTVATTFITPETHMSRPSTHPGRTLSSQARKRGQRGQSTVAYIIICAALAGTLFVPLPPNNLTAAQQLAQAVRTYYSDLTFFISLP